MDHHSIITWRLRDRLFTPRFPLVMGIINATPDSFHAPSRATSVDDALHAAERMLAQGADILDIGGQSSRPGSGTGDVREERRRVIPVIEAVHRAFPEAIISVDTWRAAIAEEAVHFGARMVNDIGAGVLDEAMLPTVAALGVPYIAMHMQGTPATMQQAPAYTDVTAEVALFLSQRLRAAHAAGIADVVLDPGFGFGKTAVHNFALLHGLSRIGALGAPVLAGLSRKRMINETLGTSPEDALNGTTVLNTIALLQGAAILRVHDVKAAVECIRLTQAYSGSRSSYPAG